jgi:phage shock protein A
MNDDLTKMRQATAQVLASQKRLENKYKAAEQASDDWYRRAQLALQKGDEDLAREALKRRKSYADNASSLKAQLDQQKGVVENLVSNTRVSLLASSFNCWDAIFTLCIICIITNLYLSGLIYGIEQ